MSTTHLTIYDLLRITYTYETRALEEEARGRSNSVCSTPETCLNLEPLAPTSYANQETDFTEKFGRKKR